jgi:hypothetical protein
VAAAASSEQCSLSKQALVELRRALGIANDDRRLAALRRLLESGRRLPAAVNPEDLLRDDRDSQ